MASLIQSAWGKTNVKRKALMVAMVVTVLAVGIVPAYAASIMDLLTSIITVVFSTIANVIIGVFEFAVNVVMVTLDVELSTLRGWGFLDGLEVFSSIIRALGVGLASFAVLWQFTAILFGPYMGVQQSKSVGTIVTRTLIFIPMAYFIQPVAYTALEQMQNIYTQILRDYQAYSGTAGVQLSNIINLDTFATEMATNSGSAIIDAIVNTMPTPILALVSIVVASAFILLILWNFLKLLFELAQRFVILLVMVYLSPLAAAAGVIGDGEIPKKSMAAFVSSGVLWLLNVWCVGIGMSLISKCGVAMGNGVAGVFIWGVITYGFLRIAQQLDDLFDLVGASNMRMQSGLLDALIGTHGIVRSAANLAKSVASGISSFNKAQNGANKDNPVKPSTKGSTNSPSKLSTYAAKASAAIEKTKVGAAAKAGIGAAMQKVSQGEMAARAAVGKAVGSVFPQANTSKMRSAQRVDAVSSAFKMPAGEARNKQLSELYKNDKGIFQDKAVLNHVGKDVLGLTPGSELAAMRINPETGKMHGIVATAEKGGRVVTSQALGISDADTSRAGAGHRLKSEVTNSSQTAMDAKAGRAQQLNDFGATKSMSGQASSGNAGQNFATMDFTDYKGNSRALQIERAGTPEKDFARFNAIADDGTEAVITAPRMATAEDVGRVLNGTASPELTQQFAAVEQQHSDAANTVSTVQKRLRFDKDGPSAIHTGTAFENSPNTGVTFSVPDGNGNPVSYQMERVSRGATADSTDSWSVTKDGQAVSQFQVPRDTGAVDAMSSVIHGSEHAELRNALGVSEDANPAMSFHASQNLTGPEKMAMDVPAAYDGTRENGVMMSSLGSVEFGHTDKGETTASMRVQSRSSVDPSLFESTPITVTDYGCDKDASEILSHSYKVTVGTNDGPKTFNCVTNRDVNVDKVVASFMTGNFDAAEIPGFEEVEKAVQMQNTYTPEGYDAIARAAHTARQGLGIADNLPRYKGTKTSQRASGKRGGTEENPVTPE